MTKNALYAYTILAILHLIGELIENQMLTNMTKPLLMVALAIYFIYSVGLKTKSNMLLFVGLLFSQVGDTLLMYVPSNANFFLAGLGAFLITQILYTIAFSLYEDENQGFIKQKPYFSLLFLAYLVGFLYLLIPNISSAFAPPIVVYACVITVMSIAACNLFTKMKYANWKILFYGVLLFVISDSLIAVNKFLMPLPHSGFLIMSTYILGQFMIVEGMRKEKHVRLIAD